METIFIKEIEQSIKEDKIPSNELLELYYGLDYLKQNIEKIFIAKLETNEPMSLKEICLAWNSLHFDDIDCIEDDIEILNFIVKRYLEKNLPKEVSVESIIEDYKKTIQMIIGEYTSGIAKFDTNIILLAKKCCEKIQELSDGEHFKFIKESLAKLADLYVQHISYLKEYERGYCDEDYISWYEEVLRLNPDNVVALKELLRLK